MRTIFEFTVNSHRDENRNYFCVSVTFGGNKKDYLHGTGDTYTLEENGYFTVIFKNTTPGNGYMNWDDNDDNQETRHHLQDINQEIISDSYRKLYPLKLIQAGDNNLSWKFTWQATSTPTDPEDETVTVTFGEDQPPDETTYK